VQEENDRRIGFSADRPPLIQAADADKLGYVPRRCASWGGFVRASADTTAMIWAALFRPKRRLNEPFSATFATGMTLAVFCHQGSNANPNQETDMNTLSTKLTAFAAALAMNGLVMSAVGYLFALQGQPHLSAIAFAHKVVSQQWLS
jgi:hypothetical protein